MPELQIDPISCSQEHQSASHHKRVINDDEVRINENFALTSSNTMNVCSCMLDCLDFNGVDIADVLLEREKEKGDLVSAAGDAV